VYGLLRTSDSLSKSVSASQTLGSIIMFVCIYALLFAVFLYVLNDKIRHGPDPIPAPGAPGQTSARSLAEVAGLRAEPGASSLTERGDNQERGGKGN
jgi:hypothetical protein